MSAALLLGACLSAGVPAAAPDAAPSPTPNAATDTNTNTGGDSQAAPPNPDHEVFDFTLSAGAYGALFSNGFGGWAGGHARLWLLDVTGERRWSGYLEYIGVHYRPSARRDPLNISTVDSHFAVLRVLRNWNPWIYTFFTLGGSLGDEAFPRLQLEAEANLAMPSLPELVFSIGGGDRLYDSTNRPYLVAGLSYSLPKAAVIYRLWYDAGLGERVSRTHLVTLAFGQRLFLWLRIDLTFGNESHPGARVAVMPGQASTGVATRGIAVSLETWIRPNFGIIGKVDLNASMVRRAGVPYDVDRWQIELQPFVSF